MCLSLYLVSVREELIKNGVVAVVQIVENRTLVDMECSNIGCIDRYTDGHGLYTRSLFGFTKYKAAPSFDIEIELLNPVVDIARTKALKDLSSSWGLQLKSFKKPKDFKNLSEEEFEPVKNKILSQMKELSRLLVDFFNGRLIEKNK